MIMKRQQITEEEEEEAMYACTYACTVESTQYELSELQDIDSFHFPLPEPQD